MRELSEASGTSDQALEVAESCAEERKEKPYSFKCKSHKIQDNFTKETLKTAVEAIYENFWDLDKLAATKKAF